MKVGRTTRIRLEEGYEVVTYSYGAGDDVLLCANGGPGLPCDYLRDSHCAISRHGYRVVAWDQLGCGSSDRPNDPGLWTIDRYVAEIEQVRSALGLGRVHFLGHSWGCEMGIEYALTFQENLKSLILADGSASTPQSISELTRLRDALGTETVAMMQRHEAEGTLKHPEYQAAITLLNHRHVCRLDEWPPMLKRSLDDWNMGPYETIQGPNEFCYTGNMNGWTRLPDLHRIRVPVLILVGSYDELTPACSAKMHQAFPDSMIHIFSNSSHMPFFEEPDAYFRVLTDFLDRKSATA